MTNFESIFSNIKLPLRSSAILLANYPLLIFITAELLLIGLWLEDEFGKELFARVGAFITIVALTQVWLSVEYLRYRDTIKPYYQKYLAHGVDWDLQQWIAHVTATNNQLPQTGQIRLASTFYSHAKTVQKQIASIDTMAVKLTRAQFALAIFGTLVWAYGDFFSNWVLSK
jgi:hypothetical protein